MKKAIGAVVVAGLLYALAIPGASVWAKSVVKPVASSAAERQRQLQEIGL